MIPMWTSFTEQALQEPAVTIIIESCLWQNTALFIYMSHCAVDEIVALNQQQAERSWAWGIGVSTFEHFGGGVGGVRTNPLCTMW
jgi:hypothetical protein